MPQRIRVDNKLIHEKYNNISVAYPDTTSEVYTFKNDNAVMATLTVTYTDATKKDVLTVVKS